MLPSLHPHFLQDTGRALAPFCAGTRAIDRSPTEVETSQMPVLKTKSRIPWSHHHSTWIEDQWQTCVWCEPFHVQGVASYYRRFIPSFAKIAHPLHAITRKEVQFEWTQDCQEVFDTHKKQLTSPLVHGYPRFDAPFVLETDASVNGLRALLSWTREDRKLQRIAPSSHTRWEELQNHLYRDFCTFLVPVSFPELSLWTEGDSDYRSLYRIQVQVASTPAGGPKCMEVV